MSDGDVVKDGIDKLAIHSDDEVDLNYKPPPEKSIEELLNADKEDASLQKYKEKLLGDANSGKIIFGSYPIIVIPNNNIPSNTLVLITNYFFFVIIYDF